MGSYIRIYMAHRESSLDAFILDASPDSLNTAWNEAVYSEQEVFNLTDKNGARLAITIKNVELFSAMPWNGV